MISALLLALTTVLAAPSQPPVSPASKEPNWVDLLKTRWQLDMDRDLRNPADVQFPAGLFVKVDKDKPVTFAPVLALGLETRTHGGWYRAGTGPGLLPKEVGKAKVEAWAYSFKQPKAQIDSGDFTPPVIESGSDSFDPGTTPFGLWVSNDTFTDGGVFTQPVLVAQINERLRAQPYKAMIYPTYDAKQQHAVPHSYLIGWEYSTNDDFQDVVTRIDNVRLLPSEPSLAGVLKSGEEVRKLAGGFAFIEGPAWDFRNNILYFSDLPKNAIVAYQDQKAHVSKVYAGQTNGLMFDKEGRLVGCENAGRRVSVDVLSEQPRPIAASYRGKKLNSPNDLWLDTEGGIYFTDPRYGGRDDLEQDKEGVYYIASDGKVTRLISSLVRPNGIAVSPRADHLYVVDNGADTLWEYRIEAPGKLSKGTLIAHLPEPDGMTIDEEGRLYVTSADGVCVLNSEGKWLDAIPVPEQPANCKFGDRDWSTLYITARTHLYAISTETRGWHVHLDGKKAARK